MIRIAQSIPDGATIVDCVTPIDAAHAAAMKADGVDGCARYCGSITKAEADAILGAGLGLFMVCYADRFDGKAASAGAASIGLVLTTTIAADLESWHTGADRAIAQLNAFAGDVTAAGWGDCVYIGADEPLSAEQAGHLAENRYWKSLSQVAVPTLDGNPIGWSLEQHLGDPRDPKVDWRHVMRGGINVDVNTAHPDNLGRALTWTIEAPDEAA